LKSLLVFKLMRALNGRPGGPFHDRPKRKGASNRDESTQVCEIDQTKAAGSPSLNSLMIG